MSQRSPLTQDPAGSYRSYQQQAELAPLELKAAKHNLGKRMNRYQSIMVIQGNTMLGLIIIAR